MDNFWHVQIELKPNDSLAFDDYVISFEFQSVISVVGFMRLLDDCCVCLAEYVVVMFILCSSYVDLMFILCLPILIFNELYGIFILYINVINW